MWCGVLAAGLLLAWVEVASGATNTAGHWAFLPVEKVGLPKVSRAEWIRNPVDQFILAGLEAKGLKPSPPATREQLIRRVTFDLIGLPPTPEEIDVFVKDRTSTAYETVVDRLLASPHYGERWARHWLDLVRYAESDGFEHDAVRPHSWRYRDYVIKSFNDDKPYDRFVREQIAGDELWPDNPEALVATSFNLLGPDMVDSADQIQRRLLTLSDMTDTTAFAFLGLTLGCARCHNHKSEPITQRDYYSLQAFFASAEFRRDELVPTPAERTAHDVALKEYNQRTGPQQKAIAEIESPYRERLYGEKLAKLSEDAQLAHRTPKEQRTREQQGTVEETAPQVSVNETEVAKALSTEDKRRRKTLLDELAKVSKPPPLPSAMVLRNTNGPAPKTFVLVRGDYNNPAEEVEPAFPAILRGASRVGARRAALADWIGGAENPLTARVMVNRIWQHHFGRGLVTSPSNFGTTGVRPTHPGLLDWLAGEFVARGWRVKTMHKLLLLSAAYQQASAASGEALAIDPENTLFSRQNRMRLEGEAVRDSLLAISGRLNPKMGGPGVLPPIPEDITKTSKNWTASAKAEDHCRRSIYIFARRNLRFPFLEAFDAPDSNLSCPERGRSTTAPQSLTLLNSDEVMKAAEATAKRLVTEGSSIDDRIGLAFRLALGRQANSKELTMAREFVSAAEKRIAAGGEANRTEIAALSELCRALFNLNAFVYVD